MDLAQYLTPTLLFPLALLVGLALFFVHYAKRVFAARDPLAWVSAPSFSFSRPCRPMERKDALPLLLLTAVYAVSAFWNLGSRVAPQSFQTFTESRTVEFSLDREITLTGISFYAGLSTGSYAVQVSADGQIWYNLPAIEQEYTSLFKWQSLWKDKDQKTPLDPVKARHFRLTASKDALELGELALYSSTGESRDAQGLLNLSDTGIRVTGAPALFDEQDVVPAVFSFENSSYFDEIYHPRTAYEHIRGIWPYEISHPPLGKLIIGLGIRMFGMTPFGWRFMGTLFGVFMLPLLYVFLKNLFGKTHLAVCGAALFAFDFMHLTQTRLATIDTYAVFFILASYYFFWRWLSLPEAQAPPLPEGGTLAELPPARAPAGYGWLLLSGLMFGVGAACKWTVLYAGGGLAVLYVVNMVSRYRRWPAEPGAPLFGAWALKTVLFSILAFVAVPFVVYVASYLPYLQASGKAGFGNLLSVVWDNQKYMLNYHKGVTAEHPYSSKWWMWLLDARPILYYREYLPDGLRSAFAAFNSPVVAWGGLAALVFTAVSLFRRKCALALFIFVGYLAQLLPWIPISRPTFAYHYFPAVLFLVLALCYVFNDLEEAEPAGTWRLPVYGLTGVSAALYALFYPVLTGIPIPTAFSTHILQWIPSWPI